MTCRTQFELEVFYEYHIRRKEGRILEEIECVLYGSEGKLNWYGGTICLIEEWCAGYQWETNYSLNHHSRHVWGSIEWIYEENQV